MKRVIILILVSLCLAIQYFGPWWSFAIPCIVLGYWLVPSRSFLMGFGLIFMIWLGGAIYYDCVSNGLIANRISNAMHLSGKYILFFITSLIGGLIGGLSCLSGKVIKNSISSLKHNSQ